jgi:transcriptional regulator with XRE-family HTH domain
MRVQFETKKLAMETLGEYLTSVRSHLGLTLEQVSQKTGIYEKFIHYIETGKYHLLPPGVYVLGFLKKLASIYNIPLEMLQEQYRKERGIVESAASEKLQADRSWRARLKKITITPKLITIASSAALGLIAFLYVVVQVFAINKTPSLVINEPHNDAVISGTSVSVSGKTEPGMLVNINGQNVFVNSDGIFHTTIGVAPGQKELTIESANKFGKKSQQVLALRVEEPVVAGAETKVAAELKLELKFTRATRIELTLDGAKLPAEVVPAGGLKEITAVEEVLVTSFDAGGTQAKLNGEELGFLGKKGEKITIPFTKDAANLFTKTLE